MATGCTRYSDEIPGARGNYKWPARFDLTDGFLGISQSENGKVKDRVLLSPQQVQEMIAFVGGRKK